MKQFLAVYTGTPNDKWEKLDEKTKKELEQSGMKAWMNWGTEFQKAIVVEGGPIGSTLRADMKGVAKATNNICGYIVVKAENHEAAAKMFLNHPHFAIFPGDAVEIMECLPIPGM